MAIYSKQIDHERLPERIVHARVTGAHGFFELTTSLKQCTTAKVPTEVKRTFRTRFHGAIILSGGYTRERAENELYGGLADLIAFGRPFINNPDLVERFIHGWALSKNLDMKTFYSAGAKGYTDYPVHAK